MLTARFATGDSDRSRLKGSLLPFYRYGVVALDSLIICVPLLFLVFQVFFHCMDTGMDPIRETISMYVWCGYGQIQTIALYTMAVLMISVTCRLYFILVRTSPRKAGIIIFALTSLGMLLVAIFPTRAHHAILTWKNILHVATAISISGLFPLALLFLAPVFKQHPYFKTISSVSFVTASIAILVGIIGAVMIGGSLAGLGIVERILMLNAIIWLMVLGILLLRYDTA